jgi:S-adenosylmethionine hydrolase
MGTLVFLTDFGNKDGFAGVLKGVALSINPELKCVDLTHEIEPFNVLEGALVLKAHYKYFPKGSVFVCVVDPGVGTKRPAIAVRTPNYYFVAPMNGLLDLVLKEEKPLEVVQLTNPKYRLKAVNNTFHGRDIFTPAGAYISKGVPLKELGKPIKYRFLLKFPKPKRFPGGVEGQIVYFDRFGNAITNIPCGRFKRCKYLSYEGKYVPNFLSGIKDKPNFTCGSFGFVEVFLPMDNFGEKFRAKVGQKVKCYYV